jgi:hypothetical protein
VTFTAGKLQAVSIPKGSVIIAGNDGLLMEADKLTYNKGVFHASILQVDRLASGFNAKGHEIRFAISIFFFC